MRKFFIVVMLGVCSLGIAQADTFNFTRITNNNPEDLGSGPAFQLSVEVTRDVEGAKFVFRNDGDINSIIGRVYFDSGLLDKIVDIAETPGVRFRTPVAPPNPPAGGTIEFDADLGARFRPNGGGINNGVNNNVGEALTIVISLATGETFDSLIASMSSGEAGVNVVGIFAQSIGENGFGDSYVTGTVPTPEPATLLLLGTGLLAGGLSLKRKRKM